MSYSDIKKNTGLLLQKLGLKKAGIRTHLYLLARIREIEKNVRMAVIPALARKRSKNGWLAIDLDSDWIGLGARIIKTIEILLYCEEHHLQPLVRFNYREKAQTDYFTELFYYKNDHTQHAAVRFTSIRDIDELQWPENYNQKLKLHTARGLFDKYLGVQQDILREVDLFCSYRFLHKKVLGVHYRGTDKAGEAPLLEKERLIMHIRRVLQEHPELELIFLSTDDQQIVQYLENVSPGLPLVYRNDSVRSTDGQQFHRQKAISKSTVNRDAMVNCLLLSKCDVLLKTASILSDCSVVFNPGIIVYVTTVPHSQALTWWPASEINQYAVIDQP